MIVWFLKLLKLRALKVIIKTVSKKKTLSINVFNLLILN